MDDIHIDQSHCNFHLRETLQKRQWKLLFRDSPSHSRGGAGTQGLVLRIVEENAWPIPDLVLIKRRVLLIVEIDKAYTAAAAAFERYREVEPVLRSKLADIAGQPIATVLYGFCKCSRTSNPDRYFLKNVLPVDVVVAFEQPGIAVFSRPLE